MNSLVVGVGEALPGFISASNALTATSDTRTALERMNKLDVQVLPVVDGAGHLAGIVDHSKLSAKHAHRHR